MSEWHSQVSDKVRSFKPVRPDFRNTLRSSEGFTDGSQWILLLVILLFVILLIAKNPQYILILLLILFVFALGH